MPTITGFVEGEPKPMGSHKAFARSRKGPDGERLYAVMVNDNKGTAPWQEAVRWAFRQAYSGEPTRGGVSVVLTFLFPRPKSHYGTGKNANVLKPNAPRNMIVKPDADKLMRAVLDCGTGILWHDDAQVWNPHGPKMYADGRRVGMHFAITFDQE